MPLTKDLKNSIKARAERDPGFRVGLFREAIEAMLSDDLETGRALLLDYVNATVGLETLAEDMQKDPKSLMRMPQHKGKPTCGQFSCHDCSSKGTRGRVFFTDAEQRPTSMNFRNCSVT